jgi:hypothetical protein
MSEGEDGPNPPAGRQSPGQGLEQFARAVADTLEGLARTSDAPPLADPLAEHRNHEQREFLSDIGDRAELMAFAYRRLLDLPALLDAAERAWRRRIPRDARGVRVFDEEYETTRRRLELEIEALTTLLYYEAASVVQLCKTLGAIPPSSSSLAYLAKVRDRFLVHPEHRRVRRASRWGGRGVENKDRFGLPICYVAGLHSLDHERARHAGEGALLAAIEAKHAIWAQQRQDNEALVRSARHNSKFTDSEITRLIVFGLDEPSLSEALLDLADLLNTGVLPKVKEAAEEAVRAHGYEMFEFGTMYSLLVFGTDEDDDGDMIPSGG